MSIIANSLIDYVNENKKPEQKNILIGLINILNDPPVYMRFLALNNYFLSDNSRVNQPLLFAVAMAYGVIQNNPKVYNTL